MPLWCRLWRGVGDNGGRDGESRRYIRTHARRSWHLAGSFRHVSGRDGRGRQLSERTRPSAGGLTRTGDRSQERVTSSMRARSERRRGGLAQKHLGDFLLTLENGSLACLSTKHAEAIVARTAGRSVQEAAGQVSVSASAQLPQ